MAISALMKLVRRYFQDTTAAAKDAPVKRPRGRRPMLVQLEERRVFNATFLLNTDGLALSNFDANSNLTISENLGNLEFQLSGAASNTWTPAAGSSALSVSGGGSIITVSRADFTGSVNFTITDAPAGNLDVIIADAVTLPTATTDSSFEMTIGGQIDIAMDTGGSADDAFHATGYSLQFTAAGEILLHDDILDSAAGDATSVTLNSDDDVTLHGQISAETSVSITAGGSIIDGNDVAVNISAPTVTLQAASGIGDSDAIETQADTLSARNTISGRIQITELSAGGSLALNVIDNANRDVSLTVQDGALTDGNDGTPGTLNITAGNLTLNSTTGIGSGDALETQITSLTASTSGNIQVTELAAGGDLTLNSISAGGGLVDLRALGGALTDGNGVTDNITAASVRLDADTGIGATDEIETAGAGLLLAAQTRTGNLQVVNTGELIVGTVGGLAGVQISSNAAISNLSLRARSPLTINSDVINNSGGNIILTAGGSAATDDLTISADVTATGGSGAILLSAGSDIIQTTGTISAAGAGAITLAAGVGTLDGVIRQDDGVRLQSVSGMIDLTADEDIRLSNLQTGHSGANSVTVTSSAGAIIDNGDTDVDIIANSGTVTLNAAVGIGHGNALETTVARLAATNSGNGNIQLVETDGIELSAVQQTSAIATGNIEVVSTTGLLNVLAGGAGIGIFGTGSISLQADGAAAGDLSVNALVQTTSGAITLRADNNVTFTANGDVTSTTGNVTVNADDDNSGAAGGLLTMADGALINAGSGTITLTSDGDVTLGGLQTTNTTATAVQVTSREGGIIDGGDSDIDISANAAGSLVTLNAETGIGHGNALEATVARLAATNSGSGNIQIIETDGIQLSAVQQTSAIATGTIEVVSTTGLLDVLVGGAGIGTFGSGSISLHADGAAAGNLSVNALVQTISGAITLRADNNVTFTANGDVASGSGNVTVNADDDNSGVAGGLLTMADGALINAGSGTITLTSDGDVTLGGLQTTNTTATAVQVTSREGGIIDGGDSDIDISVNAAGSLVTLNAETGIGHGNALETTAARLAATNSGSGNIQIIETDGIQLSAVQQTSAIATGTIEVVSTTGLLDVLSGGAGIGAFGSGSISLQADGAAAGNLSVNALVQTISGAITLRADNNVTFTVNGDVTSGSGNVTVNADDDNSGVAGGLLTMADGALINAGSGAITLSSDGDVTLGGLQTTNATASAVQVTSREGGIIDGGDSDIDIIANAAGSLVTLNAETGIGHGNALETTVARLAATNSGSGNIQIIETDGIQLSAVQQTSAIATGTIEVVSTTGLLDVLSGGAGIGTFGSGSISLQADGAAAGNLSVNALVQTISGAITLRADNNVTFTANGDVASATGNVTVSADDDNSGAAGGLLTMADGALINAGSGTITLTSDGDVTLGGLQTTNATATAVQVTSREGGIVDGGDSDIDISVNAAGSLVTLNAAAGIGHGNALETTAARLAATNSGSGNIQIIETDGIQLSAVQQTSAIATSNIEVVSTTGLLDVLSGGAGIGTFGSGSISLQADGAAAGNLSVNALVQTISGAITLRADNNVTFTANGDVASGSGNVTVNADDDNSGVAGGLLTMADGALINAGSGTITLTSDGDVTLGGLQTTNTTATAVQVTSREGGILDGGDSDIDIIANTAGSLVTLTAALGIGSAGIGDIDTGIDSLDASVTAAGSLFLTESDSISLADVDTVNGAIMITAGGQITATDVQSITDGDANDISLTATAGDIRIGLINAGATAGDVTLSTSGSVFQSPVDAAVEITADDLTIIAVNVGATTSSVFAALPDGIEVSVIDLSINATGTAAFSGSVNGTTTIAPGLQTLFIMSNETVPFSDLAPGYVTNLALIADRDNNGSGSVQLSTSLTVSGDLRIEGADVTTIRVDGEIYLTADRILFSTRTSETLRLTLTEPTAGQAGSFEGHSQNDLTVFSSTAITLEDLTPGIAPVTTAAAVTAANISITAINSTLTINGAVTSTGSGNLGLTGGTGVTHTASGDLTTTTTGTITVAATTGNVTMADGTLYSTGSGAVSVTAGSSVAIGQISTVSSAVTITATAGSISDATAPETAANISTSGTATLTAALGIGSTGVGDIDTSIGTLDASVTGAGSLFIQETDAITLLDVDTTDGAITISAGGTITATDVASINSAEANDITLTATVGDILVGLVTAGTMNADVLLNAVAGGIVESGTADADADIVGEAIELIASTGVGSVAQLEVNGVQLAVVTTTGNISILDTTDGLEIDSVNVNGDGSQTEGVSIAAVSGPFNITIRTNSPLTINSDVINHSGGNIILAAEGNLVTDDLAINANVTATGGNGSIALFAGDSISLAATVTVSATGTGNILLSGSTDYNAGTPRNGYDAPSGTDGRIAMADGALIQSAIGSITLRGDGDILLSRVGSSGGAEITITANYDGIDTGLAADNSGAILDNLTGETVNITTPGLAVLDAASGIGTITDDVNADIGQLNASVNSIGSLYLTGTDAITLTDVDTLNGSITITAGGQITATDVESLTDAEANDIILRTTAGSILAGRISAGSTGDVWLNSAAAIEESGSDATADIIADTLEINATTGIGAAGELEINAVNLGAATTAGSIVLLDTVGGLTISSVNVDGTGTATTGVTITAGVAADLLRIRTRSQLTVNNAVTNTGGGSIILAAESNLITDDLAINANVTAIGGNGSIGLFAGDSISLAATVTVSVTGTGNILLSGSTDYNGGTPRNGYDAAAGADGRIDMTSGALIRSASGGITLRADGDILLSRVESTGGGTITITANEDGIDTGLAADSSGAILDNLMGDNANITTSGTAELDAGSGIGASTDDINTNIGQLNASVNSAGSLFLSEANAITLTDTDTFNGSITITAGGTITATDVASLTDADSNDITLTTTSGNIVVALIDGGTTAGDVTLVAAGSIIEAASDAGADILGGRLTLTAVNGIGVSGDHIEITAVILDASVTGAGSIFLAETDAITLTDVDTQNGAITISAGGTITAADVASLTDADANDILLSTTAGDILVALINAGTTAGDVTLSVAGSIIETASDDAADITADALILIATNGIGVTADPIETQINTLFAENSGSGNIVLVEVAGSDLTLLSVRQTNSAEAGSINIATADGQLRLAANGFGVHSAGTGNIQLAAGGATSDLSVFSNISGNGGNITLQAGRDILLGEGNTLAGGSGPRGVAISAAGPAAVLATGGAAAGNTVLSVRSAGGFVAGQEVQLVDGPVSERAVIASVDLAARTITLTSPLLGNYSSVAQVLTRRVAATLTADVAVATAVLAVNDTAVFAPGSRVDIEGGGTVQTGVVASVDAGAGTISLTQPLTFGATIGARIFTARDQAISLSANRNLLAADGTLLTTDNLRSGSYSDLRGDRISVVVDADNNAFREDRNGDTNLTIADYTGAGGIQDGVLLLGADSRLRTDGGVASGFANRPVISDTIVATNTAFFTDFPDPSIAAIGAVDGQLRYSVSFSLVLPSPGEENVRVDIDWRDPDVGPSDTRIDSQYFNFVDGASSSVVSHRYHLNDFVNFFIIKKNPLLLDFAVSHHETISLTADAGTQGLRSALPWVSGSGATEVSETGNLSTTDNRGTTVPGPFTIEPVGANRTVGWNADDTLTQTDYLFEGGIIRLNLPAPPFMREEEPTPFVSGEMEPVPMREVFFRQLTQSENRLDEETPLEQPSSVSEDIYQLRKRGDSGDYQVEKEDIKSGERLLHPQLLRKWVADEDVSAGTGYELWLVTRKKTASGGEVVVERQLLQFDVRDQRPFPSAEDAESLAPSDLRLVPAEPAAQPGANPPAANGAALEQPAAARAVAEPLNAAADSESPQGEANDADESQQPAPVAASAIAGLVVSQALRSRVSQAKGTLGAAALKVALSLRNQRRL